MLQYVKLSVTTASETIFILNSNPIFAILIIMTVLGETIKRRKVGGMCLVFTGVFLIVIGSGPIDLVLGPTCIFGDTLILLSGFFSAVNAIVGKFALLSVDSLTLTLYSIPFSVPFLWILAAIIEDVSIIFHLNTLSWIIILWVVVVTNVIAFFLQYDALSHIEASRAQLSLNTITV